MGSNSILLYCGVLVFSSLMLVYTTSNGLSNTFKSMRLIIAMPPLLASMSLLVFRILKTIIVGVLLLARMSLLVIRILKITIVESLLASMSLLVIWILKITIVAVLFVRTSLQVVLVLKTWSVQMDLFASMLVAVVRIPKTLHVSLQLARILEQTQM